MPNLSTRTISPDALRDAYKEFRRASLSGDPAAMLIAAQSAAHSIAVAQGQASSPRSSALSSFLSPAPPTNLPLPLPPVGSEKATHLRMEQGPLDILVAEDNPINQRVIKNVLSKAGHNVTIVGNGSLAVDEWRAKKFHLVILDLQMPIMDGFEACRVIRQGQKANGDATPILCLTAQAMKGDRERCLEAGFDDYIPKPFKVENLHAVIENLSNKSKS